MTQARKFHAVIDSDRVVRVPADAPIGPVLVTIEPEENVAEKDEARAGRRANRARLAGELEGRVWWSDDAFDPLTDEELEDWYRPLEPEP